MRLSCRVPREASRKRGGMTTGSFSEKRKKKGGGLVAYLSDPGEPDRRQHAERPEHVVSQELETEGHWEVG